MNILCHKIDSKSIALVSPSASLDLGASSSTSTALTSINVMSDDQLEQFEEEDLGLAINKLSQAMNNVRFRKRGGRVRCFEYGELDHIRSHCPKLERSKKEDDRDKNKDGKPKIKFKDRRSKETLKKMLNQVYAAFEPQVMLILRVIKMRTKERTSTVFVSWHVVNLN